jgi:frataxin-like iron-binding protein CyaY
LTGSHFGWHTLWLAATLAGNHFGWQPFLARGIHSWPPRLAGSHVCLEAMFDWQPFWLAATLAGSHFGWQPGFGRHFFLLPGSYFWLAYSFGCQIL